MATNELTQHDDIVIDADRAIELIEAEVAERGADHIYNSGDGWPRLCSYERDGAPSCLVGCGLHRAGVPIDALVDMDNSSEAEIQAAALPFYVHITEAARQVFGVVQIEQDHGETWGRALERARERRDELAGGA